MNEPKRWLDDEEAPADLVRLLRSGQSPKPISERMRQLSHRRLSTLLALPAAAGVMLWLPHLAFGAVLGTAVSFAAHQIAADRGADAAAPAPVAASVGARLPARPVPVPIRPAVEEPVVSSPAESAAPVAAESVGRTIREAPPPSSATPVRQDALARELAILERARKVVATNPRAALGALARHERDFPNGRLVLERELIAIEALLNAGRRDEANARATAFKRRDPNSLYAERVRRILDPAKK